MPTTGVSGHLWSDAVVADLLTSERLSSYLTACNSSLTDAMRLYEWNTFACAAVIQTVALAEVITRNALDRRLTVWAASQSDSPSWLDVAPLDARGQADIAEARRRATRGGRLPEVHGKVVAELSFGFWRYLTTSQYFASLWVVTLNAGFPGAPGNAWQRRSQIERAMDRLGFVRNRAAHHEPIHRRDLSADYAEGLALCGWVHPDAEAWARAMSALPSVLQTKPVRRP